jgi:pyruvate dehydrogenase E1 component alpha subunit
VIYLCENNQYNEWTPSGEVTAGRIGDRGAAFDVPGFTIDGNDVFGVQETVTAAVRRARESEGPTLIEAISYRHRGHEEGEEAYGVPTRPKEEVDAWLGRDPLNQLRSHLINEAGVEVSVLETIDTTERERIADAVRFAEASELPDASEALDDVYLARSM